VGRGGGGGGTRPGKIASALALSRKKTRHHPRITLSSYTAGASPTRPIGRRAGSISRTADPGHHTPPHQVAGARDAGGRRPAANVLEILDKMDKEPRRTVIRMRLGLDEREAVTIKEKANASA